MIRKVASIFLSVNFKLASPPNTFLPRTYTRPRNNSLIQTTFSSVSGPLKIVGSETSMDISAVELGSKRNRQEEEPTFPKSEAPLSKRPRLEKEADCVPEACTSLSVEDIPQAGQSTTKAQIDVKNKSKGKQAKRKSANDNWKASGKGRRGSRNKADSHADGAEAPAGEPKAPRLPKRQCALLIGFCGTGFNGMQIQPDVRTIEGVLFEAMVKAGAVSQDNADDPVKVNLGRAARTDAGVHAAGNLISIKVITSVPGVPDIVEEINSFLPPEIRVWGYVRVQNSFNARLSCDSRKYTYFFPTYLLIPPKPNSGLFKNLTRSRDADFLSQLKPGFWEEGDVTRTPTEDLDRKRKWRVTPQEVDQLRRVAQRFEGTHNFHNFTVDKEFSDPSAKRHMVKIEVSEPAVYGDTEWVSVLFHGQSFMLHQRKMMTALVMTCRTRTPISLIDELYNVKKVLVPKMPSLGLLLEQPIFDSYNRKVSDINKSLRDTDAGYRPKIDFEQFSEEILAFKQKYIYDNMRAIEDQLGIFNAWVRSVDTYEGSDLLYFNEEGKIPPEAVLIKGTRRLNPFREKKKFNASSFPKGEGKPPEDLRDEDGEDDDEVVTETGKRADVED